MDDKLFNLFLQDSAEAVARRRDDTQLAIARQRDTAQHGLKVVEGVIAGELLRADDPAQFAGLNAGVRIPTTLDHPNAVVSK